MNGRRPVSNHTYKKRNKMSRNTFQITFKRSPSSGRNKCEIFFPYSKIINFTSQVSSFDFKLQRRPVLYKRLEGRYNNTECSEECIQMFSSHHRKMLLPLIFQ